MIDMAKSGFGEMWDRFRAPAPREPSANPKESITKDPGSEPSGSTEEATVPQYQDYDKLFPGGEGTPNYTGVQQPQEWLNASNFYNQMMQTGMPTSSSQWYQNAKGQAQTDIYDIIKQINEQAGASGYGKRYSTATARTGQEQASRRMGELGTQFAGMEMGAEEAARNRQLMAAGGLLNTGNYLTQYPLQLTDRAMGYGQSLYGVGQNQANQMQNWWASQQPFSNPWLQYGIGMATQQLPMTYPQYSQSGFGQLLGAAGSIAPYFFI
jgi:hypothetical protein